MNTRNKTISQGKPTPKTSYQGVGYRPRTCKAGRRDLGADKDFNEAAMAVKLKLGMGNRSKRKNAIFEKN